MSTSHPPKALLTDVFGTVVDWRSTVTNHLSLSASEALNSPTTSIPSTVRTAASEISWPAVAQLWRESYYQFTRSYDPSTKDKSNFKTVDQHHVEALNKILCDHGLDGLWKDEEIEKIALIWHFLDPWPDSSPGLSKLNQKFKTATLSNGNTSLLSDLAKHGNLPYTDIISAEDFGAYKPHKSVYLGAAKKLGVEPSECALIAAHLGDLDAARGCGYQTIYIERSQEEAWPQDKVAKAKQEGWVDMWLDLDEGEVGFLEIAKRFGLQ
ncbi:2-haloacid dehalogenase [Exophiala viscosa]|uniref:2-haloacid dehalogenase n=1 Tax=Exophiala viscosa TaxID=2486360 RepID=UPI0021935FA6|nr:2-haloacid dehalogenase [Exophiala viscosa]